MFGLRVISMLWTLIGHSFAWIQGYVKNVDEFKDDLSNGFSSVLISNFTLSVDTFFVLSATLTSYSYFRKYKSQGFQPYITWFEWIVKWLKFYRHRLIRLWPSYLYTLSTVTFLLSSLHSHPMWEPTDPSVQCRLHGWKNVLFLNSVLGNECMGWTWYISTEFIFYLISPIFLIAFTKSVWFGLALSSLTIISSTLLQSLFFLNNDYPSSPIPYNQPSIFKGSFMKHVDEYYIKPQYRIGAYVVGIVLGYILANMQKWKQERSTDSRQLQFLLWSVCILFAIISLYGFYPVMQGWNWRLYHVLYGATHRVLWAVAIAILIYMCHADQGAFVNAFLSARIFLPFSSLCYSVYLIHLVMVFAVFLWVPFPIVYSGKHAVVALCIVQLLLSYICALSITLFTEFPALNIEKVLMRWSSQRAQHDAQKSYPLILNNKR
ncbi:unnamed protein product [Anisakis simplex]|uniref:Acyl_transf_3 domain-containing protein n=1 Tax=Anisakis simplex TaxID=6269 RepID=A0A0M3JRD6_ANISI|nr:unnamed protein product [Anisakis simplex]